MPPKQHGEMKIGKRKTVKKQQSKRVAVAVLAPIDAARKLLRQKVRGFADLLLSFPGGAEFERDASSPRDVDL
jgi:hypothetical protein